MAIIRKLAVNYLISEYFPMQLGGHGENVELDESKFSRRKYHRGQPGPQYWVLRMMQRRSNYASMVKVPHCSAETLHPIIRHILPGTRVIMDMLQVGLYNAFPNHDSVNHRLHFASPDDPTIHTQTVEGM